MDFEVLIINAKKYKAHHASMNEHIHYDSIDERELTSSFLLIISVDLSIILLQFAKNEIVIERKNKDNLFEFTRLSE